MRFSLQALRMSIFGSRNANEIQNGITSLRGKIKKVQQQPYMYDKSTLSNLTTKKQELLLSIKRHNKNGRHSGESQFLTRSLSRVVQKLESIDKNSPEAQRKNKESNSAATSTSTSSQPDISTSNKTTLKSSCEKLSYSSIQKDISSLQQRVNKYKKTSQSHEPKSEEEQDEFEEITTALLLIILDVQFLRSELTNKFHIYTMNHDLNCLSVSVKKLVDESKASAFNDPDTDSKKHSVKVNYKNKT